MSLSVVDPLKWVRSQPTRFFNREQPDGVQLLACVMPDVITLGGGVCEIRAVNAWFTIGSDKTWLSHEHYSIPELFTHVVTALAHGEHSMRAEILIGAFASQVAVITEGALIQIQGDAPPVTVLAAVRHLKQALLFRLE